MDPDDSRRRRSRCWPAQHEVRLRTLGKHGRVRGLAAGAPERLRTAGATARPRPSRRQSSSSSMSPSGTSTMTASRTPSCVSQAMARAATQRLRRIRRPPRDEAPVAGARHPFRGRRRGRRVLPGARGGDGPARFECGARRAGRRRRDHRIRHQRELRVGALLMGGQRRGHGAGATHVREIGGGGLRQRLRALHERGEARPQQEAADVDEQQQPRDREEENEEQRRHEPDEQVTEQQLAPHAPQHDALRVHVGAIPDGDERDEEQRARHGVDRAQGRGRRQRRTGRRDPGYPDHGFDDEREPAGGGRRTCASATTR